jgi:Flp pilus assembly protein TadD
MALHENRQYEEAIGVCNQLIRSGAGNADVQVLMGDCLREAGYLQNAKMAYERALGLAPNLPAAMNGLANVLLDAHDTRSAMDLYLQALAVDEGNPDTHNNLGSAFRDAGDLEKSVFHHERAIQLRPDFPAALNNLGIVLHQQSQLERSVQSFEAAIRLHPSYADAHLNRAMLLFSLGRYPEAWQEYEWRWHTKRGRKTRMPPASMRWQAGAPVSGELMLVAEQGLGDTLMFVRYVPLMRRYSDQLVFAVPEKLKNLLEMILPEIRVIRKDDACQRADCPWLPLLSCPPLLGVTADHPVASSPYLSVPAEQQRRWVDRLKEGSKIVVGLNWQGNPDTEKTMLQGRSLPLAAFSPVSELDAITFVSLQKGFGSEQLASCAFKDRFVSCQAEVDAAWDFVETAAILMACDLIITCDTAVAHLAGALGRPTWLLLHHVPEWRWGIRGEATPWYPSVRLFRQPRAGDWNTPIEHVLKYLKNFPGHDHSADCQISEM